MTQSVLNEKLEELNSKVDEIALQKRLEIEAEHLKRISCTKFIRLFGSFSGSSFKINTRVLNDVGAEDKTVFWDLVKRVCICTNSEFLSAEKLAENDLNEKSEYSTDLPVSIYEWTKSSGTNGFTIPINESCRKLQVLIKLKNQRSVYRLTPELSKLLNKFTDTKYNIIKEIYKYVNTHKLNDYATSNVACDENLELAFNKKSFNFNHILNVLEPQLQPIFYCVIDINMDEKDNIWDIEVETDDLSQMPVLYPKIVQQFEKKIEDTKVLIKKSFDKIELLKEFSEDPARFINKKIALNSDNIGTKSVFYDDLTVQSALFELIKKKEQ